MALANPASRLVCWLRPQTSMPAATSIAPPAASPATGPGGAAIEVEDLGFRYGATVALEGINLAIPRRQITAFIGPSGCGKSTLLRCFNRMNDLIEDAAITRGQVRVEGTDIQAPGIDPVRLRRDVGMVFQKSNPFPLSIYDNVAFGPRLAGTTDRATLDGIVERSLRDAVLWDEVCDRLAHNALGLSGGQQQRLCIARAMAVEPRILLMDEPCSALDPIATAKVEDLILQLTRLVTVVVVTHNMQQAVRISDHTAFFYLGKLVEFAATSAVFSVPRDPRTEAYVTGRFG